MLGNAYDVGGVMVRSRVSRMLKRLDHVGIALILEDV